MFAYCGNNPIAYSDPTGYARNEELDGQFGYILYDYGFGGGVGGGGGGSSGGMGYAYGAVAGAACAFGAALLQKAAKLLDCLAQETNAWINNIIDFAEYGLYKCKEAAEALKQELQSKRIHGTFIEIIYTGGPGYIWSDTARQTISLNGYHCGIEINGIVYCNIHPLGLPEAMWINDFWGVGERIIKRTKFS